MKSAHVTSCKCVQETQYHSNYKIESNYVATISSAICAILVVAMKAFHERLKHEVCTTFTTTKLPNAPMETSHWVKQHQNYRENHEIQNSKKNKDCTS